MVGVGTWGSFVAMRSILASRSALVQVGPLILRSGTGANTISPWDGSRAPSMENYKKTARSGRAEAVLELAAARP